MSVKTNLFIADDCPLCSKKGIQGIQRYTRYTLYFFEVSSY